MSFVHSGARKGEAGKASIFSLLAADGLRDSLRPSLHQVSHILAQKYPHRWAAVHARFDEIFTVFDLVLQLVSFRKYQATFSEHFHDLRRCQKGNQWLSLVLEVLIPYMKSKLEQRSTEGDKSSGYGLMYFLFQTSSSALSLAYCLNLVPYHSIITAIARVKLEHDNDGIFIKKSLLARALEMSMFFVQFLDQWTR